MNEDRLDRLLRAANPATTLMQAPPDLALLNRIVSSDSRLPARRPTFALALAPIAAVLIAALVVVVANPFGQSAAAYGPQPLRWTSTQQSLSEVAQMIHARLGRSAGVASAVRASTATSWTLSVSEAGEPDEVTSISPLVTELVWSEDLSGRRTVTAGRSYPVNESGVARDAAPEGTVIDTMVFGQGEYPSVVPHGGSLDAERTRDLLAMYAPPDGDARAADAMVGIADVFSEWTLTNAQHGYLVDALIQYRGLEVLGTTQDRLERDVIGLRSESGLRPGEATTLLISVRTGRIVGMETTVTGVGASVQVPIGTVINYSLWMDTE